MKWQQIQGQWLDYRGQVKQRWGTLTDSDLMLIDGKRDALAGKLLEHSGSTVEQVEREIAEFESACQTANPADGCS